MKQPTTEPRIVNADRVPALLDKISEPAVRNLVSVAIGDVRKRFLRWQGQPEDVWRARLPTSDFDIAFFVEAIVQTFSKRELLEKLLAGAPLDEASGWDIE